MIGSGWDMGPHGSLGEYLLKDRINLFMVCGRKESAEAWGEPLQRSGRYQGLLLVGVHLASF